MITKDCLLVGVLLLISRIDCNDDGHFKIVGSQMMRFQQTYRVSIEYNDYDYEKTIEIIIRDISQASNYKLIEKVTFRDSGVKFKDFDVSYL